MDELSMFQTNQTDRSNDSTLRTVLSTECAGLLDTLGNPSSRAILREASDTARTIDEFLDVCDMSRTTVYRRVNELIDHGLLEESIRFKKGRQQCRQFQTVGSEITLRIDPDGFGARIGSDETQSSAEKLLFDESSRRFQIALSGKDLRCQIMTDEESDPTTADSTE